MIIFIEKITLILHLGISILCDTFAAMKGIMVLFHVVFTPVVFNLYL